MRAGSNSRRGLSFGSLPTPARYVLLLLGLVAAVALMNVPALDPGGQPYAGTTFTCVWCAGLLVWLLGLARQPPSRTGFAAFLAAALLTLLMFYVIISQLTPGILYLSAFAASSMAMIVASAQTPRGAALYRGFWCRITLALAGLLGTAHLLRLIGIMALRAGGID